MGSNGSSVYFRRRGFVGVRGPAAADYLNRMISNDVAALAVDESCEALLLTPKARVIAPLVVYRRAEDDFLVMTEPELASVVAANLLKTRFAAKVEIEPELHDSYVLFDAEDRPQLPDAIVIGNSDFGDGYEVVGAAAPPELPVVSEGTAERRRIESGTPLFGREIDDRVLPAEAGLVDRMVDFEKGCYPGQEPIARLHYRGHTNRSLRVLRIEAQEAPPFDSEIVHDGRVVGRLTSAALRESDVVALGYVRNEVAADALIKVNEARTSIIEPERP